MKLSILLTRHHRLLSFAAILDVFETVNRFMTEKGDLAFFEIQFVGEGSPSSLPDSLKHYPYKMLAEARNDGGVIFIPAFGSTDIPRAIEENLPFVSWLSEQFHKKSILASLCTGSFLLAATGVLNGKTATTHIDAMQQFAGAFPKVRLQPHAIVTQEENVYTSGGATNSFHLKLLLIQKFCGREMAIRVAKMFAIDMDRENQLYFENFVPNLVHDDVLVRKLQEKIVQEYATIKNIEEAITDIPSSRRNLIRRFKHTTGMTPIQYLQHTKIREAKKLLETTDKGVMEVMVMVGYNDMKNFRLLFKKITGLTPKGYREKFGMRLA